MMKQKSSKHEFALYFAELSHLTASRNFPFELQITDSAILHRIVNVLRLELHDSILLFDQSKHASCLIQSISKKSITLIINTITKNKVLEPAVTFLLPLLKRDALEAAIYSLVEIGVNTIQLITTEKTQQKWHGTNEFERLFKIMIAAAEQCKNFSYPQLFASIPLIEAIEKYSANHYQKIYADPNGLPVRECIRVIDYTKQVVLMTGPEGDLMDDEKKLLVDNQFTFCKLTPTMLRSMQAVALLAGIIRSSYNS